ncbi:hypothetical protein [Luteolibacter sp. Populi]|uniref:DUF7452 domain-containing protein n=1 Tax=Luteolibacter sp. Populi TaxID=3230487 RepID=UPI003466DCC0
MKSNLFLKSIRGGLALAAIVLVSTATTQAAGGPKAYRFTASVGNTSGASLTIDHPAFNGKANVKPVLTQFWDGVYNAHPVGFRYDTEAAKWVIENEDGAAMPAGANFNVLVAPGTKQLLCSPANTFSNRSFTLVGKGKPDALLLASHVINPVKGMPGIRLTSFFGTFFEEEEDGAPYSGKWTIYNEGGVLAGNLGPVGFNIADVTKLKFAKVPAAFEFVATVDNIGGHFATITNPLTDGKPAAAVFVKHRYRTGASSYLNEEVAVFYEGGKWLIFNEDGTAMPPNTAFVVAVVPTVTP